MRYFLTVCILLMTVFVASTNTFGEVKRIPRYNRLTHTWNSYPIVSIHDINYVPPDSLHLADSLQNNVPAWWTSQLGNYYGDTVVIVAAVVAPYFTVTYTQHGWTMMLRDTSKTETGWSGTMVRVGDAYSGPNNTGTDLGPDTANADLDGFITPARGDIIMMTIVVQDYPTSSFVTAPQVAPVSGISIDVVGSMQIPSPIPVPIPNIETGTYPNVQVNYSQGKQWTNTMIKIVNLRVSSIIIPARGQWAMVDSLGNTISDYDESYNFSFTSSETPPTIPDTSVTHFHTPLVGQKIDSIKGYLSVASGANQLYGFRICPLYPGDVGFGAIYPIINSQSRTPVYPRAIDSVSVTVQAYAPTGGNPLAAITMYKSINNGPWVGVPMSYIGDTTYQAYIFDQDGNPYPDNTFVRYYFAAVDNKGLVQLLANPSTSSGADTTHGYFYYTVLDRPLTIHDLQYTPYLNGLSPYNGGAVTVSGIVTADTSNIHITPIGSSGYGTNAWYIQNGSGPWNGIWVQSSDTTTKAALSALRNGDSVVVYGRCVEYYDVTEILDSTVTIISHGHALPAAVPISTATFGSRGNGDPVAEPYEGVLVRVKNVTVTDIGPTYSDSTEFAVADSSGTPMIVRRDGNNSYANLAYDTTTGSTRILHVGDMIDSLTGIGYYAYSKYKITPRTNADFVNVGVPYSFSAGWNMVSVTKEQQPQTSAYNVNLLYPGRSSNLFGYNGSGYIIVSNAALGNGYWVKFNTPTTIRQLGAPVASDTIPVTPGWNMIGCVGSSIATSSILSNPSGIITSKFFGYSGGYSVVTNLTSPHGYWVKVGSAGYLVENQGSMLLPKTSSPNPLANYNSVTLTDSKGNSQTLYFVEDDKGAIKTADYDMPPVCPTGFDARYSSGRLLETYSGKLKTGEQFPIQIQATGNVTVSWNIVGSDHSSFVLTDSKQNKTSFVLKGSGARKNVKLSSNMLILKIGGSDLVPSVFSLSQNYPNPFNPTTRMQIGVPEASHVTVKVYDILGQLVKTLVNDDRPEGYQTITWDGTSDAGRAVASGVYFIRMEAEKFVQIQKVVMMK